MLSKGEGNTRSKQKLINSKKMGSKKIKENHNREKPKKMKETTKRHSKGDQGSPSEKKNIKCQGKGCENIFEDHLTKPNEYNKGYHIYSKIHVLKYKSP